MRIAIEHKLADRYFRFMRNWDNETKKDLIIKLTQSIGSTDSSQPDFSSCFGAWNDNRTAEEIIADLENDRINNREIEDF